MPDNGYLIDTNILIYHTKGSSLAKTFLSNLVARQSLNISILTKIEFLGWEKHTPKTFNKCKRLIELGNIFPLDEKTANKTIELRRKVKIKLPDAVIAATALLNNMKLATKNVNDFKGIKGLKIINPFK